jgi:type VI secretion system secreted protein Hcp
MKIKSKVKAGSHEIVSPRDPASGLPTGKRMHKPFTTTP